MLVQTFTDFELVAVDDASSDSSLAILNEFATRDKRVQVFARPHGGIVATRNFGIKSSNGEFIASLDNDDVMLPQRLEHQADHITQNSRCVGVGAAALLVDEDGDPMMERHYPNSNADIEAELLAGKNPMMQPNVMFRKASLIDVGCYRNGFDFSEDYDLFLRLSEIGELHNLSNVLVKHRQHQQRASYSHYQQQQRAAQQALTEAYARRSIDRPPPTIETGSHPSTRKQYHIRCANDAWDGGNIATARKHAIAILSSNPFSFRGLELLSRTLMGKSVYRLVLKFKRIIRPTKSVVANCLQASSNRNSIN